jgi:hypothetical protein
MYANNQDEIEREFCVMLLNQVIWDVCRANKNLVW